MRGRGVTGVKTSETIETQAHRILLVDWVNHVIYRGGWAGGGILVVRRTQVTRRHLPRSLPIQTQGNGSQTHSHGRPYRGEYGSRLVRHGPRFLAGEEADGIGGECGARGGLEFQYNRCFLIASSSGSLFAATLGIQAFRKHPSRQR